MQKTLIIVLLVAVVALSGVIVYQKLTTSKTTPIVVNQPVVNQPVANQPETNQPSTDCFKEGQPLAGAGDNSVCCDKSLKLIMYSYLNDKEECMTDADVPNFSADERTTCAACGNGVCGTGENQCNCPVDCK